jgi:hypothetical protein
VWEILATTLPPAARIAMLPPGRRDALDREKALGLLDELHDTRDWRSSGGGSGSWRRRAEAPSDSVRP